ncbi:MAG: tRNA (guanosine(46)-N7)-methyltransferase TrmB [Clostridiales bacterium]|nr:tRNA (guanosine(46)-N7)-methyltransferase TrmB [Clostridiales bacterium]
MRLRNIPGSREAIAESRFVVHEDEMREKKGHWDAVFERAQPLYLEIGMGKGRFLTELAQLHPDRNYVGIEKYSSVLVRALEKREQLPDLDNLLFLRMEAEDLTDVFGQGEVSGIYLNFSDPWPKDRHAKRRLPGREFLARYNQILTPEGRVEFKTDNRTLFEFALEEARAAGWTLEACTFDLHHDETMLPGNVMTEYEERFSAQGNPICKLVISRSVC